MRKETRRDRYARKERVAVTLPLSIVTVNFDIDDNLAFAIRTAACFGIRDVYVIGRVPDRKYIHSKSGSLSDYYNLRSFRNPSHFLSFAREKDFQLVSAELTDDAQNLYEYNFSFEKETCLVLGHETTGVPTELVFASDVIYIPMIGVGYCLNTSQTGTAVVSEYCRQYLGNILRQKKD